MVEDFSMVKSCRKHRGNLERGNLTLARIIRPPTIETKQFIEDLHTCNQNRRMPLLSRWLAWEWPQEHGFEHSVISFPLPKIKLLSVTVLRWREVTYLGRSNTPGISGGWSCQPLYSKVSVAMQRDNWIAQGLWSNRMFRWKKTDLQIHSQTQQEDSCQYQYRNDGVWAFRPWLAQSSYSWPLCNRGSRWTFRFLTKRGQRGQNLLPKRTENEDIIPQINITTRKVSIHRW